MVSRNVEIKPINPKFTIDRAEVAEMAISSVLNAVEGV
jgi:hypothetical protein